MPKACIYKRPRPHKVVAKDAARFVCGARDNGFSQEQIEKELFKTGCWEAGDKDSECRRARAEEAKIALEALDRTDQALDLVSKIFLGVATVLGFAVTALQIVALFAPARVPASISSRGIRGLQQRITNMEARIQQLRAANDDVVVILRRAA